MNKKPMPTGMGFLFSVMISCYFCEVSKVESIVKNRIGYITLNQPEKRNALGPLMVNNLKKQIQAFLENPNVKIIVFRGKGPAFCSGADLEYLNQIREFSFEENLADSQNLRELFDLIHRADKVFISEVNGPALAGGCGLATICDFCFASPEAIFGYTEARIGFVPALVMVYLKEKIMGKNLREILLTAKTFSADDAFHMGLINKVVPAPELSHYTEQFAESMAMAVSGNSVKLIKTMLRNIHHMSFDDALDYASKVNAEARNSKDCIRGIQSFLNKEKISW